MAFKYLLNKSIVLADLIIIGAVNMPVTANAELLSYGGYTHDTTTDIVTGNGLEWLQWDRTIGQSIVSIQSQLDTLEGGGWSVASNVQMAQLLNSFDFGIVFDTEENSSQAVSTGYTYPDSLMESDEMFIAMFGDTWQSSGIEPCGYSINCLSYAAAIFGHDLDADGYYNLVAIADDYQEYYTGDLTDGRVDLTDDFLGLTSTSVSGSYGVALVREAPTVPVPAAVWLFGSGLLGLIGVARRKK
jgi:hypothetical protein